MVTETQLVQRVKDLEHALACLLEDVDYTRGKCGMTEMIAALLPRETLAAANAVLHGSQPSTSSVVEQD